jgi:hypothetical protein
MIGGPVDPEPEPATLYGTVTRQHRHRRAPIVPAWLRNGDQRKAFARQFAGLVAVPGAAAHDPEVAEVPGQAGCSRPWGLLSCSAGRSAGRGIPELTSMMQTAAKRGDLDHGGAHRATGVGERA